MDIVLNMYKIEQVDNYKNVANFYVNEATKVQWL